MSPICAVDTKSIAEIFKRKVIEATSTEEYDRLTALFKEILGHAQIYQELTK
jgi:hypothetical protein